MKKKKRTIAVKMTKKQRDPVLEKHMKKARMLQQALDDISIVHALNIASAHGDSLDTILNILTERTKKAFQSRGASVYMLSPNKRSLTLLLTPMIKAIIKTMKSTFKIPVPDAITIILHENSYYREIIDRGMPGIIDDDRSIKRMIQEFSDDPVLSKLIPKIHKFLQIRSVMFAPLIVADEPIGIIDISRKTPFTDHDLKRFAFIAQGIIPILSLYKSQRAYDEGRELFTEFVHAADQGFVFCDSNLNITDINDHLLRIFNLEKNDILGMNLIDLNLGALESGRYDEYLKVLQTGEPVTFTKVPTPPEFGDRYLRVKARRIGDNLILIVDDITDQHLDEQILRESETRMRSIIENQTDLICRFTANKILTFVNTAYCEYFGKSKWELIGTSFLDLIAEKDRSFVIADIDRLDLEHQVGTLEERVLMPDGSIRWQQWINRAVFDETGTIIEYQSVGRDITDLKIGKTKSKKNVKRKA
ncbi:PAS domain S-box protein [candidate division WOR-3 bacterium]|nr:PAS domain S-box protein [candidate division WOR-3 bacterium]